MIYGCAQGGSFCHDAVGHICGTRSSPLRFVGRWGWRQTRVASILQRRTDWSRVVTKFGTRIVVPSRRLRKCAGQPQEVALSRKLFMSSENRRISRRLQDSVGARGELSRWHGSRSASSGVYCRRCEDASAAWTSMARKSEILLRRSCPSSHSHRYGAPATIESNLGRLSQGMMKEAGKKKKAAQPRTVAGQEVQNTGLKGI